MKLVMASGGVRRNAGRPCKGAGRRICSTLGFEPDVYGALRGEALRLGVSLADVANVVLREALVVEEGVVGSG